MDGVGISIIERPRPLPGHDTPNPTEHPYTLKCEEPEWFTSESLEMMTGQKAPSTIRCIKTYLLTDYKLTGFTSENTERHKVH